MSSGTDLAIWNALQLSPLNTTRVIDLTFKSEMKINAHDSHSVYISHVLREDGSKGLVTYCDLHKRV